jgi:hypothetical protein
MENLAGLNLALFFEPLESFDNGRHDWSMWFDKLNSIKVNDLLLVLHFLNIDKISLNLNGITPVDCKITKNSLWWLECGDLHKTIKAAASSAKGRQLNRPVYLFQGSLENSVTWNFITRELASFPHLNPPKL